MKHNIVWRVAILCHGLAQGAEFNPAIDKYFSGSELAKKALQLDKQQAVLDAAPTGLNDLLPIPELLNGIATEINDILSDRSSAANSLDAAVKSSDAGQHEVSSCCNTGGSTEHFYSPYFKTKIRDTLCYRGSCRLGGRVYLSGSPTCATMTVSGEILKVIKYNNQNRAGSAWQYFGSETGVSTVYPASVPSQCNPDEYDPRLRPWYVSALTEKALDVAIIFDKSGSMASANRIGAARKAVKAILNMLRPFDRFGVAAFSSYNSMGTHTGVNCMDRSLAFATSKNVQTMAKWVDTVVPDGGTMYSYGIKFAQKIFEESGYTSSLLGNEQTEDRKKVFIFISDGVPSDDENTIMTAMKNLVTAVPDVITMVYGLDISTPELVNMANHNYAGAGVTPPSDYIPGTFVELTGATMRVKLGTFYSNPLLAGSSSGAIWSLPYVDSFGMGLMVTASRAVRVGGVLQGVVGYDITMNALLAPVEHLVSETTYAWMVDAKRGYLLYHPNLVDPAAPIADIAPIHYTVIEDHPDQSKKLDELIAGTVTTISVSGNRAQVHVVDGVMTKRGSSTVAFQTDCQRIAPNSTEATFVICVTQFGTPKKSLSVSTYKTEEPKGQVIYHTAQPEACKYGPRVATKTAGALKFAPRQFQDSSSYVSSEETQVQQDKITDFLKGDTENEYLQNPFENADEVKATAALTSMFDKPWQEQDTSLEENYSTDLPTYLDLSNSEAIPVWRYFGSMKGTFRVYPGMRMPRAYDPTQRGWFKLAVHEAKNDAGGDLGTFITPPYLDAFGMGYVVTVAKAVRYGDSGEIAGVFGTDYFLRQVGNMVDFITGKSGKTQLLLDASGTLIWWNTWHSKPEWVNVYDPEIGIVTLTLDDIQSNGTTSVARSLVDNYVQVARCFDLVELYTRKTLDLDRFMEGVEEKAVPGGMLKRVKGTTMYVMLLDYVARIMTVDEEFPDNESKLHIPPSLKDAGMGYMIRSRDTTQNALMVSHDDYDQCNHTVYSFSKLHTCYPASAAVLDLAYLGSFVHDSDTNRTTFSNDSTNGLEPCFTFLKSYDKYAMHPKPGIFIRSFDEDLSGFSPGFVIFLALLLMTCFVACGCALTELDE